MNLAWAAGFFDGEGSVMIQASTPRNRGFLTVNITQIDRLLLDPFQEKWGGSLRKSTGLRPDQRQAWAWRSSANKALRFLDDIEPFVQSERNHVRIALAREFQQGARWDIRYASAEEREKYESWRHDCYLRMRVLNRRGNPDFRPEAAGRG